MTRDLRSDEKKTLEALAREHGMRWYVVPAPPARTWIQRLSAWLDRFRWHAAWGLAFELGRLLADWLL